MTDNKSIKVSNSTGLQQEIAELNRLYERYEYHSNNVPDDVRAKMEWLNTKRTMRHAIEVNFPRMMEIINQLWSERDE